ncbi:MAG: hypothetical protein A3F67_02900 [Verrucomicrobia bacterium RIFCSPHIGHO2_12_FULL_41_10]|nr:MAG: hypothetical protein A3F67_02900 [Verrucomicrobia bacterium RIFCSPHIGHO2_12_FULL_41_10]
MNAHKHSLKSHDHTDCIQSALTKAEALSRDRKLRFTPLRRRVLELIWQNHQPVGAYELLKQLDAEEGCPAPPTIYRALDFLLEQGFIHRINALNAFLGCSQPDHLHEGHMLICHCCKNATEVTDDTITTSIQKVVKKQEFLLQRQWLEVVGLCKECQTE